MFLPLSSLEPACSRSVGLLPFRNGKRRFVRALSPTRVLACVRALARALGPPLLAHALSPTHCIPHTRTSCVCVCVCVPLCSSVCLCVPTVCDKQCKRKYTRCRAPCPPCLYSLLTNSEPVNHALPLLAPSAAPAHQELIVRTWDDYSAVADRLCMHPPPPFSTCNSIPFSLSTCACARTQMHDGAVRMCAMCVCSCVWV